MEFTVFYPLFQSRSPPRNERGRGGRCSWCINFSFNKFHTEKYADKRAHIRSVLDSFFLLIFPRKNTRNNACTAACTAACTDACTAGGRRPRGTRTRATRRELILSSRIPMISKRTTGPGTKLAGIYCHNNRENARAACQRQSREPKERGSQNRNDLTFNIFLSLKADISAS